MDYKKVLKLHHINKLSSKEIAQSCNCGKTAVNDFLRRFRDYPELSYPLSPDITNEALEKLLYKKSAIKPIMIYTETLIKRKFIGLFPKKVKL